SRTTSSGSSSSSSIRAILVFPSRHHRTSFQAGLIRHNAPRGLMTAGRAPLPQARFCGLATPPYRIPPGRSLLGGTYLMSVEAPTISRNQSEVIPGLSPEAGQQLLQILVDNVKEYSILTLDPKGQVNTWTPTAERLKGYTADEIVGKHFSIFYPKEDVEAG